MRITAFFGLIPESAAVVEPAKFVESPIDPRWIAQSVLRDERVLDQIHARDPTILVVEGHELNGKRLAVAAPDDSAGAAVRIVRHDRYGALPRFWVLGAGRIIRPGGARAVLVANRLQGGVANARKTIYAERMRRVIGEIQQRQRLRRRRVVPDAQPLGLEFLITRFRDVACELAFETLGRRFRHGDDDE